MSTRAGYSIAEIGLNKPGFARTRSIIEAAFYGNNVIKVESLRDAYELAKQSPGTIVTDIPVYKALKMGLDRDTKVLLFNDGSITGRYAAARQVAGEPGVDCEELDKLLMDAVYDTRWLTMYHAEVYVGLDKEFMVKAHLLVPEGEENILYSWMLNFQYLSEEYKVMYKKSRPIGSEPDLYIFSNPKWVGTDKKGYDPKCLSYFNTSQNCAAILGMRYFGEHKKGTLTMAWAVANRNGYASCHGGQKEYRLADGKRYVASVYGLSGSGKSTITHAKHNDKYDIRVLHDDAFIIDMNTCVSIALEPTYFDKTQDYPAGSKDNLYLLTTMNNSATMDEHGKVQLVTEDIRNGNGRAIKSKFWSKNRVDRMDAPVNAIFWIMKDPTLPPVIKVNGSALASAMGATLATKRSSAERLTEGVDPNKIVVVPYANPFRTYPLREDYEKFKDLVEEKQVDCYILNTGDFMGRNIQPEDTLGILEKIVEGEAKFQPWEPFDQLELFIWKDFVPDMDDAVYREQLKARMKDREEEIHRFEVDMQGYHKLPKEAAFAIGKIVDQLEKYVVK